MSVNDYDIDLYEIVEDAKDAGWLEADTPAYGVAQQVIHEGTRHLSERQMAVYHRHVLPALRARRDELDALHHNFQF